MDLTDGKYQMVKDAAGGLSVYAEGINADWLEFTATYIGQEIEMRT